MDRNYLEEDTIETRPRRKRNGAKNKYRNEYTVLPFSPDILKLVALALLVIVSAIGGVAFLKVSFPIVAIVLVIVIIMGILLHSTPVWVSVLLATAILIAGMLTGNLDIIQGAVATYFATILVFNEL